MGEHSVACLFHFFFGKSVVTSKFGIDLIIVSAFIKEISGNAVSFAFFKTVGIKVDFISGVCFAVCIDSVGIIGVENYLFTV